MNDKAGNYFCKLAGELVFENLLSVHYDVVVVAHGDLQ
jgi:hypothetical protein